MRKTAENEGDDEKRGGSLCRGEPWRQPAETNSNYDILDALGNPCL